MSFIFAQVFALQSVLKLFLLPIVLITNIGDVAKLFVVVYLFFLRRSGRLFA
jgi:hypothetical protein